MKQYTEIVSGSVDEVASNKQLTRRQRAEKPTLKYDASRPVPHFSAGDGNAYSDSHRQSATATPTKYLAQGGFVNSNCLSAHRRNGSSGSIHSRRSSAGGLDDSFGRPLSATEGVRDHPPFPRHRQIQVYRGGAGVPVVSPYNSVRKSHTGDGPTSGVVPSGLQFGAFLPPSAGVYYDNISTKITPQKREHSTLSQSTGEQGEASGRERGQYAPSKNQNPRIPARVGGPSNSPMKAVSQSYSNGMTSESNPASPGLAPGVKDSGRDRQAASSVYHASAGHSDLHPSHPPEADSDRSYGNFVRNSEDVGSNKNTKHDVAGKGTKPLSGSAAFNSAQSHMDGLKSGPGKLAAGSRVDPLPASADIGSMASVDDSGLPLHNLTASSLLNTRMGTLRKMPTSKPMPGTVHFKKSLLEASLQGNKKAVPLLLEQRPRGDGAPAKQTCLPAHEKLAVVPSGKELEEEEEDGSVPSGERLPGDGEASDNNAGVDDDDDDDGIDDLYEDCQDETDEDDYSVSSSISQASVSTVDLPAATSRPSTTQSACGRSTAVGEERTHSTLRPVTSSGETVIHPALRRSLFAAIPPTIQFVSDREKVEQLPWEIRKLLKWRMSPITPNVVKAVLRRSNFRITKKSYDWLGCFGKHMKATGFKSIREYQKLNHFPGSFQLGRKDRLWRNLSRMQVSFGKKEFGFFPQTYVLPQDLKHLRRTWEDASTKQKWIIKPPASARGLGIKVINRWSQIPRKRPVIVQKYLSKPLLINDSKFDMRVYVYVTCYHPLRAYIFEDGLARFASCKYSSSMKNLGNKFMHLTNYSINKRNANYQNNTDDTLCQGHKWSLKSLWNYLEKEGVDTQRVWESIKDMVIKTLISADGSINTMIKANVRSRYMVHELFGFDILLDEMLRPWILEVNISPSLHSSSPLDVSIKGQMVKDMMNLAGFRVPDKNDVINGAYNMANLPELSAHIPSTDYCIDKRLFTLQLSPDERAKHAYFCHKNQDEQVLQTMLDTLTPDDLRVLTESVDEDSRRGGFIRVFPSPTTKKYLRYFQHPRYYNLLLDQWVTRYHCMEQRGISLLQSLCEDGIHVQNPTSNPSHQWCPPHSAGALLSARDKNPSPLKKDPMGQKSVSLTRLPKVRNSAGESGNVSIVGVPASFTHLPPSPISHPTRPLDPTR